MSIRATFTAIRLNPLPSFTIDSVDSALFLLISMAAKMAPSLAKAWQMARPIPLPAPEKQ